MRCIPVGTDSLLVELADVSEATAFYAEARRAEELPSEDIVLGSIQVPASGQPLVFLNDHPTTGGYPVIGVVVPEAWRGAHRYGPVMRCASGSSKRHAASV